MLWPDGTTRRPSITSPFGPRKAPVAGATTIHRGCDFIGFSLVRAVAPGRVVAAGTPKGWTGGGIQVWVQHDGYLTRYMHLKNTPPVRVGDAVDAGRILGIMGRTGNVSGVHLHLEVVVDGAQVDPVPFITDRLATVATTGGKVTPAPDPTLSKEDDMQTIRHPNGTIFCVDELGADHLGDYKTADIGLDELLNANARVFGPTKQVTAREFDVAVAIAERRWARKKAEIVDAIVKALKV